MLATAEGGGCGRVFFSMLVILGHAVTAIGVMRFSESLHEHGQRAEWAGFGLGLLIQQAVATLAIFMIKRSDASKIAEPFSVDVDLFWDCLLPSVGLAVVGWILFFVISIPVALNSL